MEFRKEGKSKIGNQAQIEEDACMNDAFIPPFHGKTKGEASDWISAFNGQQYHSLYNPHEDAGDRI